MIIIKGLAGVKEHIQIGVGDRYGSIGIGICEGLIYPDTI